MRFTINSQEFMKATLQATRIIAPSRNPLTQYVKLELGNEGLYIYSLNDEIHSRILIPFFQDDKELIRDYKFGSCLIEGKFISEIVKRADGEEMTFEIVDSSSAKIEFETAKYSAPLLRAEEYPDIDFSLHGTKVEITGQDLIDVISQVSFAASVKNTRVVLTGINIECNSTRIVFAATDGGRFAKKEIMTDAEDVFNITVPTKSLQEVGRCIEGTDDVTMYVNDRSVLFVFKNTIIDSVIFSEPYQRIDNIIPQNFYYTLEVNSHDLLRALDRVGFACDDRVKVAQLSMSEGSIVVSSKSQRGEYASDKLSLYRYIGDRLEISFAIDYVVQAVRALKSEDVLISFIGSMKPFMIVDKNNPTIIHLLTPRKTY